MSNRLLRITPPEATETATKTALLYLRVSTSRQAEKGDASEGYSIPVQRQACTRKAEELGVRLIEEFVDAGRSARSADRDGLQALLKRVAAGGVEYVIVHKLDRLARNRADDVAINLALHEVGTVLVSTSEAIDDTPSGTLIHVMRRSRSTTPRTCPSRPRRASPRRSAAAAPRASRPSGT